MKADRETNRLPLRAGAMLLLAVAVVFIGLGWHHAATSGDDESDSASATTSETTAPAGTTGKDESSASPTSKPATDAADVGPLCVLNAGTVTGLAGDATEALEQAGYTVSSTGNLSTGSISENTIFYTEGNEAAATKVADAVPGGAAPDPRPGAFTSCPDDDIVVIVVSQ